MVTEELVAVLTQKKSFEFKALFDLVHANLRARNAASGGEEMLRLRAYEKLQNLVSRGMVKKTLKEYRGQANILMALPQPMPPFVPHVPSPNAVVVRSIYEEVEPEVVVVPVIVPVPKAATAPKPRTSVKAAAKPKKAVVVAKKKVSSKKAASKNGKPAKNTAARKPVARKAVKKAHRRALAA